MIRIALMAVAMALALSSPADASGRPPGCPHAWCGCWLAQHLGINDRGLWLARAWARRGTAASGPAVGAIVVWNHHVGKISGRNDEGWIVLSGNDGGAIRERVRDLSRVIAYRWL